MKQVPEGVDHQIQIQKLLSDLEGNEIFRRMRGRSRSLNLVRFVEHLLDEAKSPTDLLRLFDQRVAETRVMAALLSKYRRDGFDEAEEQLCRALSDRKHLLPGEEMPSSKLRPFTFMMLEPEKTMLMLEWIMFGNSQVDGADRFALTSRLFEAFPHLEKACEWRRHEKRARFGQELLMAYKLDVEDEFSGIKYLGMVNYREDWTQKGMWKWFSLARGDQYYNQDLEIRDVGLGCIDEEAVHFGPPRFIGLYSGSQADLLSHFTRAERRRMATWQVRLPEHMASTAGCLTENIRLGVHPESEHGQFRKEKPVYASRSVSHGLGLVVLPHYLSSDVGRYFKGHERWENPRGSFRVVFS